MAIAALAAETLVESAPARAFTLFTDGLGRWWPLASTVAGAGFHTGGFEPGVGGDWYEVDRSGRRAPWGRVLAWEPPVRLAATWALSSALRPIPNEHGSRVEVTFAPADIDHSVVRLSHSGFERHGDDAEAVKRLMGGPLGWEVILAEFARAARFD